MDTAYQNFFKHQSGFPRFKAKYDRNQSYQTYQDESFSYDKSKLYLPKMQEGIKCIFSRKIEGKSRLVPLVVIPLVNTMLVLL